MSRRTGSAVSLRSLILIVLSAMAAVSILATAAQAQTSAPPMKDESPLGGGEAKKVEPLWDGLPIWGRALREKGFNFPLPFGLGVTAMFMEQTAVVTDLQFGSDPSPVPGVQFKDVKSSETNFTFRPDAWLLPVLDLYGIIGSTGGEARFEATVPLLELVGIADTVTIADDVEYDAFTYGGGATLAFGWAWWFALVDANYTRTKMDILDGEIEAITVSPRTGTVINLPSVPGEGVVWIGAMYLDYKQDVRGSVNIQEIDPYLAQILGDTLEYRVRIEGKTPWNLLLGGQWAFDPRWGAQLEVGLGDRKQIMGGISFRF